MKWTDIVSYSISSVILIVHLDFLIDVWLTESWEVLLESRMEREEVAGSKLSFMLLVAKVEIIGLRVASFKRDGRAMTAVVHLCIGASSFKPNEQELK